MDKIVERIKKEMQERKLSTYAVAEMAGLNQAKVQRIVSGKSKFVDADAISKIVSALGISELPVTVGESPEDYRKEEGRASREILPPVKQVIWDEIADMTEEEAKDYFADLRVWRRNRKGQQ